jgi:sarcosine oxidase, subunit alpha
VRRLDAVGDAIDHSRVLSFMFDGHQLTGFAGDTLASALLANGVDVVCRSPIQGRPRGVYSAGAEEPCAFVGVDAPSVDPVVAATTVDLIDGLAAHGVPGVGRLPAEDVPPARSEHRHGHVETLVIGGSAEGVAEANGAAGRGDRVMLVESQSWLRGDLSSDVEVLRRATALGVYEDGYVLIHERSRPIERVWHVRARNVVLATGAHERPIAFADNDRPGVMLATSARTFLDRFGVVPGKRAVVFTTNHAGHEAALALQDAGVEIAAIADVSTAGGPATDAARARGIDVRSGWTVAGTDGEPRLSAVHLAGPAAERDTIDADLLLVSGGWNPVVQLWRAIGGGLRYDERRACFVPDGDGPRWLSVVGAAAGDVPTSEPYWFVPADDYSHHYVDMQRDQTVADVLAAVEHDLRSVEHIKRATYIGTALDQGRTSGVLTAAIVNQALGAGPDAQGPTNARPPYTPVSFAALAGADRGQLFDPARVTPIHSWHVERGAPFENVGQWKRPWYFPSDPAESMDAAVLRESLAVRTDVGVMDASTLGKIDVTGPDAGVFLDRMYTNRMSTLRIGSIRYGLMCGVDGMAFDDGVAMRLADDRFFVTTTTGGAAKVLEHFEEWLQTEWPHLRVYCTSVTEQWSTIAMNGPRAREVLAALGTDVDLSAGAFPFMTFRDGTVAGMPARIARVSFSGELAYELSVAGWHGLAMWESVMAAGEAFGITPYGTEAMHVLRAEKGFPIIGQDTDGTVTPHDLGMSWIVRKDDSDFLGKRSFRRVDTTRPDRKQLVGLLPVEPQALIPEGAQLVVEDTGRIPMAMVGHVTSSYRSAVLDRTFALAMLERGHERHGETVFAPLPEGTIAAEVTPPVFYDPEGARRDG